jgi:hypothetical protein
MARRERQRGLTACAALALAIAHSGCSSGGPLFGGGARGEAAPPPTRDETAAPATAVGATDNLTVYLDLMQQLIQGDALTRAAAFNDAEEAADFAPTTTNRLRYALALSVPGHSGSDPAAAAERLGPLLAAGDALLPEERILATIQLRQVEQLLILSATNAELTRRVETAVSASDAESAARLRSVLTENERLRKELEDATAMLDAIANIERSISESEVQ